MCEMRNGPLTAERVEIYFDFYYECHGIYNTKDFVFKKKIK